MTQRFVHPSLTYFLRAARLCACCVVALSALGCMQRIYPRTAEVLPDKRLALGYNLHTMVIEPQQVVRQDRSKVDSVVGFFPDMEGNARFGTGTCEIALAYAPVLSAIAEVRCPIVQERWGAPISVAFSGAAGATKLLSSSGAAPNARIGIDISHRIGNVVPLIDIYLSTGTGAHYITTSTFNTSNLERQEVRLTIPIGVSFGAKAEERHPWFAPTLFSATAGIVPWIVLAGGKEKISPDFSTRYTTDFGASLTFGVDFR
jgi:hypothetical protein